MKNKPVKILALLLALTFVFSFSACKKTEPGQTTTTETTAEVTTLTGETTTEETTAESTTAIGETTMQGTTAPNETTTAAALTAPVGGSIAKIVAFYNQHANATKNYQGKITVKRDMGTETTITKMVGGLKQILQGIINDKLKPESKTKTFNNGHTSGDPNDTLPKFLPRGAGKNMSDLEPAGVKSATCVKYNNGWKVTITLYKEVVSGLNTAPKHHTSVMDPITIDENDLKPLVMGEGHVTYGDVNSKDTGASLTAIINEKGYLETLNMDAPLQIAGKLGGYVFGKFISTDTVIDGKWWGDMTFTYA